MAGRARAVVGGGLGVNVAWPVMAGDPTGGDHAIESDLDEVAGIATALNWLGAEVDRVDLLVAYLRRLDEGYGRLVAGAAQDPGPAPAAIAELVEPWRQPSATLGRRVRGDLGRAHVDGTADAAAA